MSDFQNSLYRGCTVAVLMLLILTVFCLVNLDAGTAPFYLCIFSLIVDVPFLGFLLYKRFRHGQKRKQSQQEESNKD